MKYNTKGLFMSICTNKKHICLKLKNYNKYFEYHVLTLLYVTFHMRITIHYSNQSPLLSILLMKILVCHPRIDYEYTCKHKLQPHLYTYIHIQCINRFQVKDIIKYILTSTHLIFLYQSS